MSDSDLQKHLRALVNKWLGWPLGADNIQFENGLRAGRARCAAELREALDGSDD